MFLAEIAWRWIFGAVAIAFLSWTLLVFLNVIEVSKSNLFLLRTLNPDAVGYAMQRIFAGKGPLMLKLLCLAGPSLTALWIVTATIGRVATTRVLLEHSSEVHGTACSSRVRIPAVAGVQTMRAVVSWLGVIAYIACAFLAASAASMGRDFNTGLFVLVFLLSFTACILVLLVVHWWLGLAPIFVMRDGSGAFSAVRQAASLARRHAGQFTAVNFWHGLFRMAWIIALSTVGAMPLGLMGLLPGRAVATLVALASILYFAGADLLFVARYAGYVEIAEQDRIAAFALRNPGTGSVALAPPAV